jgi:hypothetical protein
MMGAHWVRWDVPGHDDTARLFDCLGFVPLLFDVHGEDEDWAELKTALKLLGNGSWGYGLPGGTVISADSRGTLMNPGENLRPLGSAEYLEKEYLVFVNDGGRIHIE